MAFKSLIAICLLATYAQGQFYPNYGFGYQPQVQFMRPLPVPQPPRLPGPFQPPPLPQPPLLPVFGPSFFEIPEPLPGSVVEVTESYPAQYPTIFEFNRDGDRAGGSFSGMTISSTSNGKGGVTIISTNDNGKTQTFVSPSPQGDSQFYRIPSSSPSSFSEIPSYDRNAKPSKFKKYQANAMGSTFHMSSKNGEKPKVVSQVITYTNDNGKVGKKVVKYAN